MLQDICFAFVATATMYADQFLEHKEKPCEGSVQEMMDRLHIYWPPRCFSGRVLTDDELAKGLPNSFTHTFKYVKEFGLFSAHQYPFVRRVQDYGTINIDSVRNNIFIIVC